MDCKTGSSIDLSHGDDLGKNGSNAANAMPFLGFLQDHES